MTKTMLQTGEISSFCMELYLILQAGIPLFEGVQMLAEGEHNPQSKRQLTAVAETLTEGYGLAEALKQSGGFPQYMVDMVSVGEQTGNLDRGLKGLATYYQRQEQMEHALRRGVIYPAVLLTMLSLVLLVLVVKVLPMFEDVYEQLGGTLTGVGGIILSFGTMLSHHWLAALGIFVLVLCLVCYLVHLGRRDGRRVLMSKRLGLGVATAKLAAALSMALQSGLDSDMALELAETLTQHPDLRKKIGVCRTAMAAGAGFAETMGAQGVFTSLHCRMLGVGVRTGTTDEVMEDIARRCDRDSQTAIDHYIGSVEPTLVMVMSLLVGVVLLSVMLPLASIMTSLG